MILDHVMPAAPTDTLINVISTDDDLISGSTDITVFIKTGIDCSLGATAADGFDFRDGISQFKQPTGSREQMSLEISS